ncbi:hypothetical protein HNY73_021677 [Argiope bruennichi]|uniref:Uncharacterized protein n=1 Tax=Argiope bruennichi TaxID=94029 RepID=A0A8T0E2H8_ARGBR|nr:hypothetical protein HNY73_021677 [Argiope bruennichi]
MDIEWDVKGFFSPGPEIPSREKHKCWIYAFSSIDDENIVINYWKIGKWLLFFDNVHRSNITGLTEHDYNWQFIKKLAENDILLQCKCSTALKGICEAYDKSRNGIICCYTLDYTNKQDVKRAAEAIRKTVHCPFDLFYKTNIDTKAGKYRYKGDRYVCIYKHTVENKMYERDLIFKNQWNLVKV